MKYFVVSDIHSFGKELRASLRKVGYSKSNPEHVLIVCGDIFDRGDATLDVYKYIYSIPRSRRVLIKGNHESLFKHLLKKSFPESHDYHNGTVKTFCQIANIPIEYLSYSFWHKQEYKEGVGDSDLFADKPEHYWQVVVETVKKSPIYKWLCSSEWQNYYEIGNYIFVHSFIPVKDMNSMPWYYDFGHDYVYDPDWRNVQNWEEFLWGCPYSLFNKGLFDPEIKNNKILVCGHWHTSDFHEIYERDYSNNFNIYYGEHLIALDACTAYSGQVNVLVIDMDTNKCYDQNGELSVKKVIEPSVIETVSVSEIDQKDEKGE